MNEKEASKLFEAIAPGSEYFSKLRTSLEATAERYMPDESTRRAKAVDEAANVIDKYSELASSALELIPRLYSNENGVYMPRLSRKQKRYQMRSLNKVFLFEQPEIMMDKILELGFGRRKRSSSRS